MLSEHSQQHYNLMRAYITRALYPTRPIIVNRFVTFHQQSIHYTAQKVNEIEYVLQLLLFIICKL